MAFDFETGKVLPREVTETILGHTFYWVDIVAGGETITATRGHPIWVDSVGDWVDALDLEPGMVLRDAHKGFIKVESVTVRELDTAEATYNFEVDNDHNYFVGESQVLVHNGKKRDKHSGGYWNYTLRDKSKKPYYNGMAGPNQKPSDVMRRHAKNGNRFNPANGDYIAPEPGTRAYGKARLMENNNAIRGDTILPDRDGANKSNFRGNRQRPIAEGNEGKYGGKKSGC